MEKGLPDSPELPGTREQATLGALDQLIQEIRARLKPGGPEVDYPALYAHVAGALSDEECRALDLQVATWRQWHDAYWAIRLAVDGPTNAPKSDNGRAALQAPP